MRAMLSSVKSAMVSRVSVSIRAHAIFRDTFSSGVVTSRCVLSAASAAHVFAISSKRTLCSPRASFASRRHSSAWPRYLDVRSKTRLSRRLRSGAGATGLPDVPGQLPGKIRSARLDLTLSPTAERDPKNGLFAGPAPNGPVGGNRGSSVGMPRVFPR